MRPLRSLPRFSSPFCSVQSPSRSANYKGKKLGEGKTSGRFSPAVRLDLGNWVFSNSLCSSPICIELGRRSMKWDELIDEKKTSVNKSNFENGPIWKRKKKFGLFSLGGILWFDFWTGFAAKRNTIKYFPAVSTYAVLAQMYLYKRTRMTTKEIIKWTQSQINQFL